MNWKTNFCKKVKKQAEIRGVPTPYFHIVKEWPRKYVEGYSYASVYFDFGQKNRGYTTWCLFDAELQNLKLQGGGPDASIVVNQSLHDEGLGGSRKRTPREVMGLFALFKNNSKENNRRIDEGKEEREYEREILDNIDDLEEIAD